MFPPDPSGDVGGGFYVQAINGSGGSSYIIYNTIDGTVAAGPFTLEGLGSGGACASGNGDPIIVFDQLASRWLLSEFSSSGNNLCVYISATSNPVTTTWARYAFVPPGFPDYPKYGVWPDAYYVGANQNNAVYALDRTKMLAGLPATFQRFGVPGLAELGFEMLPPASVNGIDPPPAGMPGTFLRQVDDERNNPGSNDPNFERLELFTFKVDFTTPANSALTGPINLQISEFDRSFNVPSGFGAIPQPGVSRLLDPLFEVIMFPLHYRAFGTTETITANFVTEIGPNNQSGIRWLELRRTGGIAGSWTVFQEGTYAPSDVTGQQTNRWRAPAQWLAAISRWLCHRPRRTAPTCSRVWPMWAGRTAIPRASYHGGDDAGDGCQFAEQLRPLGRLFPDGGRSGRWLHVLVHWPVHGRE